MLRLGVITTILATVLNSTPAYAGEGIYVVVTSDRTLKSSILCSVAPASMPPQVEHDQLRLKVTVVGTKRALKWRLPLYKKNNGSNDIAVARVGNATPDTEGSFFIDLNVADVQRAEPAPTLRVELETQAGQRTACTTDSEPIRRAALPVPARELTVLSGSVAP